MIAKNYLAQDEIESLNLIVSLYLDFAELQARNRKPMHMQDWISKLDDFLRISDREILTHAGRISHEMATLKAETEYEKFRKDGANKPSLVEKDFEAAVEKMKSLKPSSKPSKPGSS